MLQPQLQPYISRQQAHQQTYRALQQKHHFVSTLRVAIVLGILAQGYFYAQAWESLWLVTMFVSVLAFLWAIQFHQKIGKKRDLANMLAKVNEEEIAFLKQERIPFNGGSEYSQPNHPYTNDLDIFGDRSLFQHLNRTGTSIGKKQLAAMLQSELPPSQIEAHQEAIQELREKLDWRQELLAISRNSYDSPEMHQSLVAWAKGEVSELSTLLRVTMYLLPVLLVCTTVAWAVLEPLRGPLFTAISAQVVLNLIVLVSQFKKLKDEMIGAERVAKTIEQYGVFIEKIEAEPFSGKHLQALHQKLMHKDKSASHQMKRLSFLFAALESLQNSLGTIMLNGTILYHLHQLNALFQWKRKHGADILIWLEVIGEVEALNSLANFSYNNPAFVFPSLSHDGQISFTDLGHPLINEKKRVCNSVQLPPFVILTGSNMSGKSTFLRALGVNMVLAGIGAPVCATKATIHPLPVFASMRQSDSLADSESYFFAEVKRLKLMMEAVARRPSFVLLDEILKGTNSDDKRSGTLGVITQMLAKKAVGVIATHDLDVCLMTNERPQDLVNQCFEVAIINNELHFDYQLKDGICQNKSATFLMKKMQIIE